MMSNAALADCFHNSVSIEGLCKRLAAYNNAFDFTAIAKPLVTLPISAPGSFT